jgi:hypothetical protein
MCCLAVLAVLGILGASGPLLAQAQEQARLRQVGRAIIEHRSRSINAVAAYEYSQTNHDGAWLLVELAVLTRERIAIERDQISLLTPGEQVVPVAAQQQFLADQQVLTQLMQNATVSRRPLSLYFTARPVIPRSASSRSQVRSCTTRSSPTGTKRRPATCSSSRRMGSGKKAPTF